MLQNRTRGLVLAVSGIAIAALVAVGGIAAARGLSSGTRGPAKAGAATTAKAPTARATSSGAQATKDRLDPYRGLGMWVDIYDTRAWNDPRRAVRDMAAHGVRTVYVETGNSGQPGPIFKPQAQAAFITEAHAHGMYVVAWYLPNLTDPTRDYQRSRAAIQFRTPEGQRFDSFALDIEADKVPSISARNSRLATISQKLRNLVGADYVLGGIIPSPAGLARAKSYWPQFPYATVARTYDVVLPMSYYSYHGDTYAAAYVDTLQNVRILRAQKGAGSVPIHLIGGVTEESSARETAGFVRAANEKRVIGSSFYGWTGMGPGHWREVAPVEPKLRD